jgi:hypothetical protein
MTTGIETNVTLTEEPVQVPDGPEGAKSVVVQLWVRSDAGSWSGCLRDGQAEDLGRNSSTLRDPCEKGTTAWRVIEGLSVG